MQSPTVTRVLLIEDDEDDYVLTQALLSEIASQQFTLEWAKTFEAGLEALRRNDHDVALVDYRLGAQNGIDLLRAAVEQDCHAPVILLTGSGQHQIDLAAMNAGAADYLVKSQLRADSLERSIRYAIQRQRAAALAAFEQQRLASFGAAVGLALTRRDSLEAILQRCADAMAQYLNASVALVSTYDPRHRVFEPRGFASDLSSAVVQASHVPRIHLDLDSLAKGNPVLVRHLARDERCSDRAWPTKHRLLSYAACPLVIEEKLVGLMSLFSRDLLPDQIQQEMRSVADGIALCIERKRSEEALDASEDKYRSVVENIKEIIFQIDEFGQWIFLNPAWTALTGFEVTQTLGTFFLEYLHEEEREQNRHIFLQLVQRKLNYCRYETRFLTNNGKVRWVEAYVQAGLSAEGVLQGITGSLTDITERKLAESAIQKLAAFPRVNPNPVLEFAGDGTLTYANDAARELARSLGKDDLLSLLPENAKELVRLALDGGQRSLREVVTRDGHTIAWSFFPVAASHVVHCYGADVTEMLNLEAQLRHAQKLESVGQLAAGVAHDFNNVLTVIQGYTETLISRCQGDGSTLQALKQISDGAKRAAGLTRQLLMFSRKQVIQTAVLDLNNVLRNVTNMLTRLLGEDIALETHYAANLPRIEADTGMLEQIVMNLAVNSRDAMPGGGRLRVRTEAVEIDSKYLAQHPEASAGPFVCLTVEDTGCGMDRHTMERIFEPFFTTKEVGKGTGLGLATVYGIVKQHRGWIEVASEVGLGTTFMIYFPAVAAPEAQAQLGAVSAESVRGGHETILVVEDEPVLRELVCEVLGQYKYRILQAGSGNEALRVWDEFEGEVDLLLTDMVMPEGMSGRELAAQLRKRKPSLKLIFSSGYSPDSIGRDFSPSDAVFLSKPYLPPQLAQTVRQCLDGVRLHTGEVLTA